MKLPASTDEKNKLHGFCVRWQPETSIPVAKWPSVQHDGAITIEVSGQFHAPKTWIDCSGMDESQLAKMIEQEAKAGHERLAAEEATACENLSDRRDETLQN